MSVDLSKIRPGDEVTVRFYAKEAFDGGLLALSFRPGTYAAVTVHPEAIVSHTPKALQVGDRVKRPWSSVKGEIIATHSQALWVLWDDREAPMSEHNEPMERVDV